MDNQEQYQHQPQNQISSIPITNQNEAFQLLVYFINVAYKRNTFSLEEASKIYECIKMFSPNTNANTNTNTNI